MLEINMEWYRAFYWIAKTGSLSKAAEKMYITQPAISRTLKQLEAKLGGQLFFRTARGVQLTTEGEVLFRYMEQAFSFVELGEKKLAEMHSLTNGEINIGASDTLCKHYLLPYLEQFHKQYPDIRIRITNRTTPETISLLKEGKIDFGIIHLPIADQKLHIRQSSALQDCLVAGQQYAALSKQPMQLKELHQYPLLLLEEGGSTRHFINTYANQHGAELQAEFELGSLDLLVQFARSNFGLAFVIRSYVEEELASGALVEIPLLPVIPERYIGIATLREVPVSAASRQFLKLLP